MICEMEYVNLDVNLSLKRFQTECYLHCTLKYLDMSKSMFKMNSELEGNYREKNKKSSTTFILRAQTVRVA